MDVFIFKVRRLWNDWELRAFILTSLTLQIILIFSGSLRKRNASRFISLILWSAYLLADWVATFALGILSKTQDNPDPSSGPQSRNDDLQAFWAPFLLLHLGGPDTITAFSLEDNELWLRHLLGLIFQVVVALYVFIRSLPETRLKGPAFLMFLAGILNYGERSWSLRCASTECLRNSMVTSPDPGPNYAKFMEKYTSQSDRGLQAKIVQEPQLQSLDTVAVNIADMDILSEADKFFQTFKRLIVDLILSVDDRKESQPFFLNLIPLQAFNLIEIELSFLYEALYTKAPVIHTTAGPVLRGITFSSILSALLIFVFTKKQGYKDTDTIITYILLAGALVLESYAVGLLVISDWTVLRLKDLELIRLSKSISLLRPTGKARWSNLMAQYNLLSFCLKDQQKSIFKMILDKLSVKEMWDRFWHTNYVPVEDELKAFLFKELKRVSCSAENYKGYKNFSACRGELALQKMGYWNKLDWSVEVEFDESILLWHIATDLCYYSELSILSDATLLDFQMSKSMSDYMLYILVVRPSMLTIGVGHISRYGDTCAEAKNFFQPREVKPSSVDARACEIPSSVKARAREMPSSVKAKACDMLLSVHTKFRPIEVKGDRSKSVLFDGCRLAKVLLELDAEKRWKIVSAVWVEILCYAASHCRGYFHAKQLSAGGELLTLVWFLMAHLGIGEFKERRPTVKLIVKK